MKTFTQFITEGAEEHETFKDHTKNPYHDILTKHGFEHKSTEHQKNPFARNNPRADSTVHVYTHPNHGKTHVIVTQEHDSSVGHGGRKVKGHGFLHRHEQSNGIMAPSTGDSKPQLHQSLSYHYGVPKGMEAPKLTASEKRYPHTAPKYKMNEAEDKGFSNRVRFNWGYHDGASQHHRGGSKENNGVGTKMGKSHPDQVYVHGYHKGYEASDAGKYDHDRGTTTSDAAWKDSGLKDGHSQKPHKLMGKDSKGKKVAPWMAK